MYITLTKKKLFVVFCVVCVVFFMLVYFFSVDAAGTELPTNEKRVEYIKTLDVTLISDDCTSKTVVIPREFSAVYNKYNALQKQAGYDLARFKGKEVTVYTYNCEDNKAVNLIIFKDKLIGGDIAETSLGGSMTALKGVKDG